MAIVTLDSNSVRTTPDTWRAIVKSAIRDPSELVRRLKLSEDLLFGIGKPHEQFRTFVPVPFLNRMVVGDPNDPLLLQVLPRILETDDAEGFQADAVGDLAAERAPGLMQKYEGRVLLMTRGVCAIHCRYCFRRHFPYQSSTPASIKQLDAALQTVRADRTIEEVILSGGDPLMMVDETLARLVQLIDSIDHVRRLRIHTRLPIVVPQRVTQSFLQMLDKTRLSCFMVVHVNHPNEIDNAVRIAFEKLNRGQVTMLNQSVLLRGVNDDLETLVELSKKLIDMNCLPYYLHQLDRVAGAAHFEVDESVGKRLVADMRSRLPGYAVPTYVRESAGQQSKTVISQE